MDDNQEDFKTLVIQEIERFVQENPGNRFDRLDQSPMYQAPIVGFASGVDPLFLRLKQVIGDFHLTPVEALTQIAHSRGMEVPDAEQVGVISYVLPIS